MSSVLAQLSPQFHEKANAIAAKMRQLGDIRASGETVLARILADLERLRDIPADVLALEKECRADAETLGQEIAAELVSLAGTMEVAGPPGS